MVRASVCNLCVLWFSFWDDTTSCKYRQCDRGSTDNVVILYCHDVVQFKFLCRLVRSLRNVQVNRNTRRRFKLAIYS